MNTTEPYRCPEFLEEFDLEELTILTVHAFGVEFTTYYPTMWDTLGDVVVHKDGLVSVSSGDFYPLREDWGWYQGDEAWGIGHMPEGTFDNWGNMVAGLKIVEASIYIQCEHEYIGELDE